MTSALYSMFSEYQSHQLRYLDEDGITNDLSSCASEVFRVLSNGNCLYCATRLQNVRSEKAAGALSSQADCALYICEACGWWYISKWDCFKDDSHRYEDNRTTIFESLVRRFEPEKETEPIQALRSFLLNNPSKIYEIHPIRFEQLVADIYRDYRGCSEVRHVGGPGDNGVDLYAVINDQPHLIQIKRRSKPSHVEEPRIVRELLGAMILEDIRNGHLVTTAVDFGPLAWKYRKSRNLARNQISIELKRMSDIAEMMRIGSALVEGQYQELWDRVRTEVLETDQR